MKILSLFTEGIKLKSYNAYKNVHRTIYISEESIRLLTESPKKSNKEKIQEGTLRVDAHLCRYRSISEKLSRLHGNT